MLRPYLLISSFTVLSVLPLQGGEAPKYPIHIQVRKSDYKCAANCDARDAPPTSPRPTASGLDNGGNTPWAPADINTYFTGVGRAVFLTGANKATRAFWFGYDECLDPHPTYKHCFCIRRCWKNPGHTLEVMVPPYSSKGPANFAAKHMSKCVIQVSTRAPVAAK